MPSVWANSRAWMAAALVAAAVGLAIAVHAGQDNGTNLGDGKGGTYRTQMVSAGHDVKVAGPTGTLVVGTPR